MFLGSFVLYTILNNVFLVFVKKSQKVFVQKSFWFFVFALYVLLLSSDLYASFKADNHYKFFKIHKFYTNKELNKRKKELLSQFHPDRTDDTFNYVKTQELFEIFSEKKKNKNLISAYNYFNIDIHEIFFDKYADKDYDVFHLDFFNHFNIKYYIIAFIQLFSLKEIKNSSKSLKFYAVLVLGLCFLLECCFYKFYGLSQLKDLLKKLIDKIDVFRPLTYFQILFTIKRGILSIYYISLFLYVRSQNKSSGKNFDKFLKTLNSKLETKQQNIKEELKYLTKKVKKTETRHYRAKKVYFIFVIFSLVYFAMSYYESY